TLQERCQTAECRHADSARSGVFVVLHPLKPCSEAELMNSAVDLQVVRVSKEISTIRNARRIVRSSRCDSGCARSRRSAADHNSTGTGTTDKRQGGRK